jgi:hypothetical protein
MNIYFNNFESPDFFNTLSQGRTSYLGTRLNSCVMAGLQETLCALVSLGLLALGKAVEIGWEVSQT